jgi:hypothetical protein
MSRTWVYKPGHPKATERGFVAWEDYGYVEGDVALNAPVLVDRFYENTAATDGTDIGSRRKHREYMKRTGLAPSSDFSPGWYERQRRGAAQEQHKERREAVARATYEVLDRRK